MLRIRWFGLILISLTLAENFPAVATKPAAKSSANADPQQSAADPAKIQQAMTRGLTIVQKAAANYPKHRECFSCHHQTLPMLAMTASRSRGASIDETILKEQGEFSLESFTGRKTQLNEGTGIGGRSMTVAYGLWALKLAARDADETTEAMVTYLLKTQKPDGYFTMQSNRPPLEESNVMCTVLSIYGLRNYQVASQKEQATAAIEKAKTWLATAPLASQEDKTAKLWGAHLLQATDENLKAARDAVLADQHEDGGWSQLPKMTSDAYATGQALFILQETGLPATDPAFARGVQFLLKTQGEDGSWLVETRSKPIQQFFDNGDPHGKHQFIVIPATSWAVAALARVK